MHALFFKLRHLAISTVVMKRTETRKGGAKFEDVWSPWEMKTETISNLGLIKSLTIWRVATMEKGKKSLLSTNRGAENQRHDVVYPFVVSNSWVYTVLT